MTDFDLDLDGTINLQEELDDLEDMGASDRVEVVGSDVEYGVYLEFGTEDMPPYPWFRPAIREFKANSSDFITDNTDYNTLEQIPNADALVTAIANALVNQMTNNVSAGESVDRSPGTTPDHPQIDTGTLKASISAERD